MYTRVGTSQHAFLISAGNMTTLPNLPGGFSSATGINNNHQIVGGSDTRARLRARGQQ